MNTMRGVQHPVGPQSEAVYWRRRAALVAAVGGVLVLLIWVVARALGGGSGTPAAQTAASQPSISIHPSWPATVWA
ncbi:MAG: hypothetical protein L0K84_03470, partial [Acidipropionibacterium jensenii]|nr:hypothetical protein [Acidipropionibacterium jensenii]